MTVLSVKIFPSPVNPAWREGPEWGICALTTGRWGDGDKEIWRLPQKVVSGDLVVSPGMFFRPRQCLCGGRTQPQDGAGVCGGEEPEHSEREALISFLVALAASFHLCIRTFPFPDPTL